ncbi:MAG: chemotaxis protein CheW [Gemmatimonadales bacterium]
MGDAARERVVICRTGAERIAIPVTLVREVVALPLLTRIPGAPGAVRGLANVQGVLVTVLNGAALAGLDDAGAGEWLVVLTARQGHVGLAVDEVEELVAGGGQATRIVELETIDHQLAAPS